ncbi:hypothetical protein [Sphingobium olei]|uniref:Uncharacterized protein n=1 Tax=Sphingobium olei TaxID=420955 RepID=A0ABW3NYF2_9SPHN
MSDDFRGILACYRSGQMSERQWQAHLSDPLFRIWLSKKENDHVR